jgi:hypothetical protein
MAIFDDIKYKNVDEFAEWLDKYGIYDNSPWMKWWDDNYCNKCKPETTYVQEFNKVCSCAWCEINNKCKYFQEFNEIPDSKHIIKMWLESEDDNGV